MTWFDDFHAVASSLISLPSFVAQVAGVGHANFDFPLLQVPVCALFPADGLARPADFPLPSAGRVFVSVYEVHP